MEKSQELTEKSYHEGVERGKAEEARIIAEAQAKAEAIVAEANEKAAAIAAEAKKAAAELDQNTRSELKMYAGQALNALKSEITTVVSNQITSAAVADMTAQKDFLGQMTVALAQNWGSDEPIVIGTEKADEVKAYFAAKAKELLDKGVKIEKVNGKDTLFTVAPADGSYKVQFGEAEFTEYFKEFLRPQLVEMLF